MKRDLKRWLTLVPAGALFVVAGAALSGCGSSGSGGVLGSGGSGGPVATVDGQAISRTDLDTELEAMHGDEVLDQMIEYQMVLSALKAQGLDVTDAELSADLAKQAKQDPSVQGILTSGGPQQDALTRQTRLRLAINKLLTHNIMVGPTEIQAWFNKNHARYDTPERIQLGILFASSQLRADTMEGQLKSKSKTFLELVSAQKQALDPIGQQSVAMSPPIDVAKLSMAVPPEITQAALKLKTSEISPVVTLQAGKAYAIVTVVKRDPIGRADFAKVKDQVEIDCKMDKIANPTGGATDPRSQNANVQKALQALFGKIKTAAHVEVLDPNFARVAAQFASAPGALGAPAPGGAAPAGAPSAP